MDLTDVRSYRPISNLLVASKLLARLVAQQLLTYLDKSGLLPRLQSAYRAGHSTEIAVLKVLSAILLAIDAGDLLYLLWCCWICLRPSTRWTMTFAPTAENIIRSVWNGAGVVSVILGCPAPVCPDRIFSIYRDAVADSMRCTTRVSSWPHSVSFVHRRPYAASSGSRSLPTSLRRRHTGVRFLLTVCVIGAAEHHH